MIVVQAILPAGRSVMRRQDCLRHGSGHITTTRGKKTLELFRPDAVLIDAHLFSSFLGERVCDGCGN
jgi:hypothetical protein